MSQDETPNETPLFSELVCEDFRKLAAEVMRGCSEVEGLVVSVIYKEQLGDQVDPSMVLAGPAADPRFLNRVIRQQGRHQQKLIEIMEGQFLTLREQLNQLKAEYDQESTRTTGQETDSADEDGPPDTGGSPSTPEADEA